jgi:SPP1 family predicted phage head-tail adaptor
MPRVLINPKELRHPIIIEERFSEVSRNEYGEELNADAANWKTVTTAHAGIQPLAGRQLEYAKTIVDNVSHLLTVRFNPAIAAGQRIRFGDRTFAVNAVIDEQEMKVKQLLYCTEVRVAG